MNERTDRTCIIWILGGVYLLYLTVKLGRSLLEGALGWQAGVFPVLFGAAGIVLIVKGIKRMKMSNGPSEASEIPADDAADKE